MARITQKEIHGVMTDVIEMDAPADELEDALRAQIAAEQAIESAETAQDAAERAEEAALRAEENIAGVSSFNGRYGAVKPQAGDYTAEDVGAASSADHLVKTYTSLAQVGLSVGSETIESMAAALPAWSELRLTIGSSYNTVIYPVSYGSLIVAKYGSDASRVIFEFTSKTSNQRWLGVYDSTTTTPLFGWVETANPAGFLPRSGGILNGNTKIETIYRPELYLDYIGSKNCRTFIRSGENYAWLAARNSISDATNLRAIQLEDSTMTPAIKDALQFINYVDSKYEYYKIYGEHNKPTGSYTGNGSTTQRIIPTGGLGDVVVISSTLGNVMCLRNGSFAFSSSTQKAFPGNQAQAVNGEIILATNNEFLNKSGQEYKFWVL